MRGPLRLGLSAVAAARRRGRTGDMTMNTGTLGRVYEDGEILFRQGDVGDVMYVVQEGEVEIVHERDGRETPLAVVAEGGLVGEMAIFLREPRSATPSTRRTSSGASTRTPRLRSASWSRSRGACES
jgi:Cyclic nucleotide-binding domain